MFPSLHNPCLSCVLSLLKPLLGLFKLITIRQAGFLHKLTQVRNSKPLYPLILPADHANRKLLLSLFFQQSSPVIQIIAHTFCILCLKLPCCLDDFKELLLNSLVLGIISELFHELIRQKTYDTELLIERSFS